MVKKDGPSPFANFDERMAKAKGASDGSDEAQEEAPRRFRYGEGIQVGIELVAGIGGGCLIGWGLDQWLGTKPILLVIFFFLGAAGGMLNAYRRLRRYTLPDES